MKSYNHSTVFSGLVIDIEQMEVEIGQRGRHTYQIIRHPGGAGVLPVHDDGTVSLIRQLRPAVDAVMLEIPAGRLSPGEPPSDCAAPRTARGDRHHGRRPDPAGDGLLVTGRLRRDHPPVCRHRPFPGRGPAGGGRGDRSAAPAAGRGPADGRRRAHQRCQDPGGPVSLGSAVSFRGSARSTTAPSQSTLRSTRAPADPRAGSDHRPAQARGRADPRLPVHHRPDRGRGPAASRSCASR